MNIKRLIQIPDDNWIKRKRRMRKDGEDNNNN